jgi:hypothetical protein
VEGDGREDVRGEEEGREWRGGKERRDSGVRKTRSEESEDRSGVGRGGERRGGKGGEGRGVEGIDNKLERTGRGEREEGDGRADMVLL